MSSPKRRIETDVSEEDAFTLVFIGKGTDISIYGCE